MAVSPRDVELEKINKEKRYIALVVTALEKYLDDMLLKGFVDILVDQEVDDSLNMDLRGILKEKQEIQDELRKRYRIAGWKIEFEEDFRYISFKEA